MWRIYAPCSAAPRAAALRTARFNCGGLTQRAHAARPGRCQAATTERQSTAREKRGSAADGDESYVEEDFYSLLGVSPLADTKDIKRAYYSLMRTCHPDRASLSDEDTTDFCALLNEVYETLTDPSRRAVYDALAGFSEESVNPFMDDRYPADRVFVDEFTCIGCRNCNNVCPKSFGMEEEYGRARVMQQDADTEAKLQEAIDTCPVSCIHWVTAPQLSLLEAAMARMGRVAVWSMMGGTAANRDVFTEASLAWTKRQAEIRQRLQEASLARAPQQSAGWSFWGAGVSFGGATSSTMYGDAAKARQARAEQAAAGGASDRESRGVADLAARAARAARTWRRYQEVTSAARRNRMSLASVSSASISSVSSMDDPAAV